MEPLFSQSWSYCILSQFRKRRVRASKYWNNTRRNPHTTRLGGPRADGAVAGESGSSRGRVSALRAKDSPTHNPGCGRGHTQTMQSVADQTQDTIMGEERNTLRSTAPALTLKEPQRPCTNETWAQAGGQPPPKPPAEEPVTEQPEGPPVYRRRPAGGTRADRPRRRHGTRLLQPSGQLFLPLLRTARACPSCHVARDLC